MSDDCGIICGPSCAWIFSRLRITPHVSGGTVVEWAMHPQFGDSPPFTFQLQVGKTGLTDADDWEDVGLPVTDIYSITDDTKRDFGQLHLTHYRVVVTSSSGVYASEPQSCLGNLSPRDWLKAKSAIRMESLALRKGSGQEGYLLKRRLFGTRCSLCTDMLTGEVRDSKCPECYGTGFTGGYHPAYPCFYVNTNPAGFRSHRDQLAAGNHQLTIQGRMINVPQVFSYDVWVDKDTDQRWFIHRIQAAVEVQGVAVILYPVEMRLAPFTDQVYKVPVG